jgi:hypothetical protein
VGQLGKSGEYWMRRMMCGLVCKFRASKVVAPLVLFKARVGWLRMNML